MTYREIVENYDFIMKGSLGDNIYIKIELPRYYYMAGKLSAEAMDKQISRRYEIHAHTNLELVRAYNECVKKKQFRKELNEVLK